MNLRDYIYDSVVEYVNDNMQGLTLQHLIDCFNRYCDNNSCNSDILIPNDAEHINMIFEYDTPFEILTKVSNGDYHFEDSFFNFDGYDNIVSYNNVGAREYIVGCSDYVSDVADKLMDEIEFSVNIGDFL